MQALLALRQEAAALLGHASHAEVSLVPKMARSTQEVGSSCATWRRAHGPTPSAT